MNRPKITAGAAYNALMTEESKESLTLMVIDLLRQLREAKSLLDARQWHDAKCPTQIEGTPFDLCRNDRCVRARAKMPHLLSDDHSGEDFHFEDSQIMTMLRATEYYKATISHALSVLTTGEKWTLYRAVVALADAQREIK